VTACALLDQLRQLIKELEALLGREGAAEARDLRRAAERLERGLAQLG
jgi:hypothetical protein